MILLRKLHRWIGLLIGLQVVLWLVSGLAMSFIDPDKASGRLWSRRGGEGPQPLVADLELLEPHELPGRLLAEAMSVRLRMVRGEPMYRIERSDGPVLVRATDASPFAVDAELAEAIAARDFIGEGEPLAVSRGEAPDLETRGRKGPYWRVDFSDDAATSIYVSEATGSILERRNRHWRLFDLFWMLHIMDYRERTDFNHPLIVSAALVSLWLGASGVGLLFGSFRREDFRFLGRRDLVPVDLLEEGGELSTVRLAKGGNLFLELGRAGISLPSNCGGGGTCGLCSARLEQDSPLDPRPTEVDSLSEELLGQGYRLTCQRSVVEGLRIHLDPGILSSKPVLARVESARYLTPFIKEIRLTLEWEGSFEAGSYFQVEIPPHEIDARPRDLPPELEADWAGLTFRPRSSSRETLWRAYSPANRPGEMPQGLSFLVRFQPPSVPSWDLPAGIGSTWMHSLQEGQEVRLRGPFGHFRVQESQREMVFVGGGAGMAPLRSMVLDQLENRSTDRPISFWYGARNPREILYRDLFESLQKEHELFGWQVAVSGDEADGWDGHRGFIHQVVHDHYLASHPDPASCELYVCGPPAMLEATLAMLDRLGVDRESIRYDDFGG